MQLLIDLFRAVLEASWQSSLVILLILLVRLFMGMRIPARWRHLLWTLVILRLLIPISLFPPNPVSIQNFTVVGQPLERAGLVSPPDRGPDPEAFSFPQGPEAPEPDAVPPSPPSDRPFSISWWGVCSVIWLAGALLGLGMIVAAQISLGRRLAKNQASVDPSILAIWNKCLLRLRLSSPIVLRLSPDVGSPALVGLLRPVLLLPERNLALFTTQDWENVFVHELAHYRRRDHWIHALQLVTLAVHWFNPLVWLGFRRLRADRELAADEWALHQLEPEQAQAYGGTLLKVLEQASRPNLSLASVGILEDRVQLKQRLQRIIGFTPRTLTGSLVGLGIVAAVAVLVLGRQVEKVDLSDYDGLKPEDILVMAARRGDMPVIREMLRDGVDVNVNPIFYLDKRQTPLCAAIVAGREEAMRFLIAKGADVNQKIDKTRNSLMVALEAGRPECAAYLLSHGATCDPDMLAAAQGNQAALQPLLAKEPVNRGRLKDLAKIAAVNGHAELFLMLLEKIRAQPGPEWSLSDDDTVLVIARGHREVVQAVIGESPYAGKLNQNSVMRIGGAAEQSPGMREWLISKGFVLPPYTDGERLIDAAEDEDIPEMASLLKKGVDINYRGESSWTPITKAATWNRLRSVKFLLEHGADPNSVHIPGVNYTGICLTGSTEVADLLLAAGGNINATVSGGVHIMYYSVFYPQAAKVKWFLDHGVDPTKVKASDNGQTFLFDAGNAEIAEMLIDHGVDPKARAKDGTTALHWVCMFGRNAAETARVLLKHGADPNARSDSGVTPLMWAKDGATVDVLIEYGADIHAKTRDGQPVLDTSGNVANSTRMEALIRHGAPFNPKTDGATMLLQAAWMNQVDIMLFLLNRGVDPNAPGVWSTYNGKKNMMTPLQAAVVDGQYDAALLLVEHGARIDHQVMSNALFNRRVSIVKLFWEHGAHLISPLTYAVSQGAPVPELEKLVDQGNPINPPQDEDTPLNEAALLGDLPAVEFLVDKEPRDQGKDQAGVSAYLAGPLQSAASEGQDEVVDYLIKQGAKANEEAVISAANNSTPYDDQRGKEHFEKTIKILLAAGALKGISQDESARILESAIFTRQGPGNQAVVKMLLEAGLSLDAPGKNGKSAIQIARENSIQTKGEYPSKELMAFLEQANKK